MNKNLISFYKLEDSFNKPDIKNQNTESRNNKRG